VSLLAGGDGAICNRDGCEPLHWGAAGAALDEEGEPCPPAIRVSGSSWKRSPRFDIRGAADIGLTAAVCARSRTRLPSAPFA
jgi:hypothetical protein